MKKRHLSIFGWNKKRLSEKKSKRDSKELKEVKPTLKQLHDAIYEEKIEKAKTIIESEPELINQKKNARTALHIAARSGNSEMVEILLSRGANPNIADDAGWTGIHCAAFSGNVKTLEEFIKDKNVNLAVKNADDNTALHYIARHCVDVPEATLNDLIKGGIDINSRNSSGETPLHNASWKGNISITDWLLKNKANTESRTDKQETPLHWAARAGQTKIAEMLIAAGASLLAMGVDGLPYDVAVPIDKLKKMLKIDPAVLVKTTAESNVNIVHTSPTIGRRDTKSFSLGSQVDAVGTQPNTSGSTPLDISMSNSGRSLLSPLKGMPPLSPTTARTRSSSFSKASNRLYLRDELSANNKTDSRIKLEGQMRARLESELTDELLEFTKTTSLLAIISKVLESRSWNWSEVYDENKIEMLKWICEFVEKDKKYQYLEYLFARYKEKIKIEVRDGEDSLSDSDDHLTCASFDSEASEVFGSPSGSGTSSVNSDESFMKKVRRLTLREKKLTPYSWELDLNEVIVNEVIGQGGFGLVYRGTYKNEEVAIKQLKTDELGEEDMMAFLKEISIMSSVKHENILTFKGACVVDVICLVTEYAQKGDLRSYLLKNNVDFMKKLDFALQIARGVNYLHSQDPPIVHRDLKCSNILIDKDDCVKVSDFGLSKHTSGSGNTRMGTLNWIAPEILRNAGPFTEKADVFSYGIVVWEIFTNGQIPYQGLQPLQVVRAIDEGVRPEIPSSTDERARLLIEKCWAEDCDQRPNFVQIISMLESFIQQSKQK